MKRQIRMNVFETNSSSTHAICIVKDGYELKDHIDFHTGEYGWECEEYGDLNDKASYLITAILSMDKEYADEKLMEDCYLETFVNRYTSKSGDRIVAFGKYGYEG